MKKPLELKGKKVLMVGFGITGKSVTRFLLDQRAIVTVNDIKGREDIGDDLYLFESMGAEFVLGNHPDEIFLRPDLIVVSPGVNHHLQPLIKAQKKGIPVISEIELASRFIDSPIIGITGTNGKSTTTALIAKILSWSGYKVFLGGNIGTPLITYIQDNVRADFLVVELSSFQLENIKTFAPHIAILLNITEDHLDRYSSFASYCKAKFRIFMNQTESDFAIINRDDETCKSIIPSLTAKVLPFSHQSFKGNGMYSNGKFLYFQKENNSKHVYDLSKVKLLGKHNQTNMLAAIGTAELCGCPHKKIQESLESFQGLDHRLEFVREIDGVSFYNDSKATNIDSLLHAIQTFSGNLVLIAGGREKGGDYGVLKEEIKKRVKTLILIGESREKLFHLFGSLTHTCLADDLKEAVQLAFQNANKGDVILLSPGCASFDMFSNYEERGKKFKEAVQLLANEKEKGETRTDK
jgi:UDP-N-acetylmuramoylalanine--D-glutamate ligase